MLYIYEKNGWLRLVQPYYKVNISSTLYKLGIGMEMINIASSHINWIDWFHYLILRLVPSTWYQGFSLVHTQHHN
jgi:hypothetical protein